MVAIAVGAGDVALAVNVGLIISEGHEGVVIEQGIDDGPKEIGLFGRECSARDAVDSFAKLGV